MSLVDSLSDSGCNFFQSGCIFDRQKHKIFETKNAFQGVFVSDYKIRFRVFFVLKHKIRFKAFFFQHKYHMVGRSGNQIDFNLRLYKTLFQISISDSFMEICTLST